MKKILSALAVSAVVLMGSSGVAKAAVGDIIDLDIQGSTYAGSGPVLTNGYDYYPYSISSATGEANKRITYAVSPTADATARLTYTTNASTAISNIGGSSAMQSQPTEYLFDGYMTGNPGVANSISFSSLDPNQSYKLVVYSQAESGTTATLKINGTQVINNVGSGLTSLTEATAGNSLLGNYAVINGLTTNASGVLAFTYQGQISGLQVEAVPEPASVMLLGVGGLLFGLRRNRQKAVA
ncbi:PEP-CTERM sorting domain-containing protein [Chlorobaculum sp. 24CR]|uniref:PEP-CTERM sorting domain-containing protein n=1 Tax=Chlorobaculum sp. 24CR TaxID=2508878 RepID=UPI00100A98C6|nr:PEP-CTERM sorting domain-containing protein [Chlorobaculum sp. 24CR]RXK87835.1 PEP-CTERM sorting domain-containing protein [Chlorobaculum sp. 24CR]